MKNDMTPEKKSLIDGMSYEDMLELWRFAPSGHSLFLGDTGQYYAKRMQEKRKEAGEAAHVAASKSIGW